MPCQLSYQVAALLGSTRVPLPWATNSHKTVNWAIIESTWFVSYHPGISVLMATWNWIVICRYIFVFIYIGFWLFHVRGYIWSLLLHQDQKWKLDMFLEKPVIKWNIKTINRKKKLIERGCFLEIINTNEYRFKSEQCLPAFLNLGYFSRSLKNYYATIQAHIHFHLLSPLNWWLTFCWAFEKYDCVHVTNGTTILWIDSTLRKIKSIREKFNWTINLMSWLI